jgi:DNA-binding NarL/FixJ family response regulator
VAVAHHLALVNAQASVAEYLMRGAPKAAAALRAGASGYPGKGTKPEFLLHAIWTVTAGESLLSPDATTALIGRFPSRSDPPHGRLAADLAELTAREREIATLLGAALSNDEIAGKLFISPATAKTHVNRAMMKVGARDQALDRQPRGEPLRPAGIGPVPAPGQRHERRDERQPGPGARRR